MVAWGASSKTPGLYLGFTLWALATHVAHSKEGRRIPGNSDETRHDDTGISAVLHNVAVNPGRYLPVVSINACCHSLSHLRIKFNLSYLFLGCCWCPFPYNFSTLNLIKGSQVCVFIALRSCVSGEKDNAEDVCRCTPSSPILLLLAGYLKQKNKWSHPLAQICSQDCLFFFFFYGWCSSLHRFPLSPKYILT